MSEELPEGWTLATPDDLSQESRHSLAIGPFGSNLKVSDYTEAGVPLVFVRDIRAERFGGSGTRHVTAAKARDLAAHTVRPGDLLVTKMGEPPGDTAVYPIDRPAAIITADCIKLSPNQRATSAGFLKHCLRAPDVRRQIAQRAMGVAQQKLSLERFRTIELPLPPVAEQHRIVEGVEALLAHVKVARERLGNVPVILRRFRQSVLAAACAGRLTDEWRQRSTARVSDDLPEASLDDVPALPEIPEDWKLVPLRAVVERFQYGTSDKANGDERTGIPVLRMGNVQDGRIDLSDLKYVSPSELRMEFLVQAGDVLFNRTNSPELVGKTAVVQDTRPMAFASYLIRMRTNPRLLAPEFLGHWLNSWWGRQWARHVRTDGVGQSNINATKLAGMPIPLPTIAEQREITARIDQLLDIANTIERRVMATSASADALAQGILAKAFRGELVPTEAELARADGRDYESGEALLARIQVERAPNALLAERSPRARRPGSRP